MEGKSKIWAPKHFNESTTFVIDSCWSSKQKVKAHVLEDPDSDPSSSDPSSSESDHSDDSKYIKPKSKRRDKNKNRRKRMKQDSSYSSPSNSDSSDESDYRRKKQKNKRIHRKKYPIKLCARLTGNFLVTAYKSKIIKFKLGEDPLQRRVYFLGFVESLEMIFSQYK